MRTPRYTDNRYLNGYRPAAQTNVALTFRRIRAEQKAAADLAAANKAEAERKTLPLKRKTA